MSISLETRQAYSEVDEFLELLSEEQRNEIPKKIREFFKTEKDQSYNKNIKTDIPIKEQKLKKETLAIIALLNLQYWCKDEIEKNRLKMVYAINEKNYQEELYEKYNPNRLFKNKNNNLENTLPIITKRKNIIQRFLSTIKSIFKK